MSHKYNPILNGFILFDTARVLWKEEPQMKKNAVLPLSRWYWIGKESRLSKSVNTVPPWLLLEFLCWLSFGHGVYHINRKQTKTGIMCRCLGSDRSNVPKTVPSQPFFSLSGDQWKPEHHRSQLLTTKQANQQAMGWSYGKNSLGKAIPWIH